MGRYGYFTIFFIIGIIIGCTNLLAGIIHEPFHVKEAIESGGNADTVEWNVTRVSRYTPNQAVIGWHMEMWIMLLIYIICSLTGMAKPAPRFPTGGFALGYMHPTYIRAMNSSDFALPQKFQDSVSPLVYESITQSIVIRWSIFWGFFLLVCWAFFIWSLFRHLRYKC